MIYLTQDKILFLTTIVVTLSLNYLLIEIKIKIKTIISVRLRFFLSFNIKLFYNR